MRKIAWDFIEKYILKHAMFSFFVSHTMKRHFEKKYQMTINDNYFVMPCFNTELHRESFFYPDKYKKNVFAYAGRLTIWQGFNRILKIYEEIEALNLPDSKLLILTPEKEEALESIKKTSIVNYEIDSSSVEDIPSKLSKAKYGFIIRDDITVNRVATPTKLSTYVSNGLIPVYSECIEDFHRVVKRLKFKLVFDDNFKDNLMDLASHQISATEVYDEFKKLYDEYYNKEKYIMEITAVLSDISHRMNVRKNNH